MKNLKKLTILHSNDMHGDFMAKSIDDELMGGVSMLSGYVNKVRNEEENVIYTISGDMFRGSLIDSEFKGVSTIEIMNMLTPDVVTLGNHEIDYGIAHLLFLEKCARFPIINANVYIKTNKVRLFKSHVILEVGGMKVLFIGILTESILNQVKKDALIGSFVDVHEAADEIGKICDSYQTEDIDFTVLLTHIGFEEDKKLAALLNPDWGVDIIIGGHSHTLLSEPAVVNNIPIVQAASGTNQIGRFDITVDTDNNCIDSYTWQLVPIDDDYCPRDLALENVIKKYKDSTDEKYGRYITRFSKEYTHPRRDRESDLGKIFCDALKESLGADIIMIGSGSLRRSNMGPIVDYGDLSEMFPYEESVTRVFLTGKQIEQMLHHIYNKESMADGEHYEYYQFSKGIHFVYHTDSGEITDITFEGKPFNEKQKYSVGIEKYHFTNFTEFFGIDLAEAEKNRPFKVIATSACNVIEEWLCNHELVTVDPKPRWETV